MSKKSPELIVALDVSSKDEALHLVRRLKSKVTYFKVGLELFTRAGPDVIAALRDENVNVFLDLKYMDIPNTVYRATTAAADLGVDMVTVHTSSGQAVLQAAAAAGHETSLQIIGVTVLTSMDEQELSNIGITRSVKAQVHSLAASAQEQGLNGVVCSPQEITELRALCGNDFLLVVPGIRPKHTEQQDQKRAMTPQDAAVAGADFVVVGRPITQAEEPSRAASDIIRELKT